MNRQSLNLRNIGRIFTLALILCSIAGAQTSSGTIVGTVTDSSGAVVPGASVTITNSATGVVRNVVTGDDGQYLASLLPIGVYSVEASKTGFKKVRISDIELLVNQAARSDIVLGVGAVDQTVEVSSEAVIVQTDRSDVGQVVGAKQVVELPLNGRNFIQLATLAPGTMSTDKIDGVLPAHGGGVVVNGASTNANQITLDGVENQDFLIPRVGVHPSPDAIAEFKVMGASYSAEYGRGAGANINVVIKSGTNDFHGSAYWFHRNDNFDARNFFSTGIPEFKRNQYGGTLGGPVFKNKTFFFGSFEGLRRGKGLTVNATVPTDAQRAGNVSTGPPIYDPLSTTTNAAGVVTRTAFPGNVIPQNRIAPEATKALDLLWPRAQVQAPDVPNGVFNPVEIESQDQAIARVDHHFTDRDTLWGRYAWARNPKFLPINLSSGLPKTESNLDFYQQNAVIGYTKVFSPTLVNDARIGYNYFKQNLSVEANDRNYVAEIGIQGALEDPLAWGPPNINITGITGVGAFQFSPSVPRTASFEYMDTLAITKSSHNMKVGADIRRARMNGTQFPTPRGVFGFTGGYTRNPAAPAGTGQGIADFLLGFPTTTSVQLGRTDNDMRMLNGGFFFQDDWNVSRNVTLNLGLRWNYMPQPVSAADRIANWSEQDQAIILAQNDLNKPTACAGCNGRSLASLIQDFKGIFNFKTRDEVGWPRSLVKSSYRNFEPRLGFAWRLFGNNDTVLRAGYGRFYEIVAGNVMWNYTTNPPLSRNLAFTGNNNDVPILTLRQPFPASSVQGAPGLSGGSLYDSKDPYQDNWNVSIQRRILPNTSLDIAYVGSRGTGQRTTVDFNSPTIGTTAVQSRRPHPEHGSVAINANWGHRRYDSMQIKVETRTHQVNLLAAYTWAKGLTWGGGGINESFTGARFGWNSFGIRQPVLTSYLDPNDAYLSVDKGPGAFDLRQRLSIAYVWDLPFGTNRAVPLKGIADTVLGGWEMSGILTFEAGIPVAVAYGVDNLGGAGSTRPNLLSNPNETQRILPDQYFTKSAFGDPIPLANVLRDGQNVILAAGNAGRAPIIGPGVQTFDLGLFKNFAITERLRAQLRGEFFNALNHTNFGNPNTTFTSAQFGRITSTSTDARVIQVGLKFTF